MRSSCIINYSTNTNTSIKSTLSMKRSGDEGTVQHMSANACLTPLVSLHGMAVTTVEGIGSTK